VLLAVQCPLQMNPITQPQVHNIHTAVPHFSYTLHCAIWFSLSPPPPEKNFTLPFHPLLGKWWFRKLCWNWPASTEFLLLLFMYDKLARTYHMSLPYSTTLLNLTVIHSCPLCFKFHVFPASRYCVFFAMPNIEI